jgi:hypothetical protein
MEKTVQITLLLEIQDAKKEKENRGKKLATGLAAVDCSQGQTCIYKLVICRIGPMRCFIEEDVLR